MIEIKKILVATDFSEGAEQAYPVAQKLASTFGSKVDFIHVIPTIKYLNESIKKIGVPFDMEKDLYPKVMKESEHQIEKALNTFIREENTGEYFVKIDRKPSDTIVKHAMENDYDLIIMGTRGRDLTEMFRGTTAEKVIRSSKVPVFSVDASFNENEVRNIVVPTDTSAVSFAAFPLAVALASVYNSEITLFHVLELYGSISENIPRKPDKDEKYTIYESLIQRLNDYLSDAEIDSIHIQNTETDFEDQVVVTEEGETITIPLHTNIVKGVSAHIEIENFASEEADLVVIATHGYSGFSHLILGSTAEKVAENVEKPVVTIRPDKDQLKSRKHLEEEA